MKKFYLIVICVLLLISCSTLRKVEKMKFPEKGGLIISNFTDDSVLEQAGARKNDVLWKYNGVIVESVEQLGTLKQNVNNNVVDVIIFRQGKLLTMEIPAGQIGVYLMPVPQKSKIDKDAVVIEGIGKLDWSMGYINTYFGALMRLDELKGQKVSYEDLIVLSGYGFRTSFFEGWCPSSPDATCGYNSGVEILSRLGYDYELIYLKGDDECLEDSLARFVSKDEMTNEIKASIDEGWPLLAIDLIQIPEWGVITGYQKNGQELLCRTYFDQTDGYEIARKMPFLIIRIHDKKKVEIDPLYKESLELAKTLYETKRYNGYTNGIFAIDTWLDHLRDEAAISEASPEKFAEMALANTWTYYSLTAARAITADYLEKNIALFDANPDIIRELSDIYHQEADALQKGYANLAALEGSATPETWTIGMRAKEILTMEDFRNLEFQAQQLLIAVN